MCSSAGGAADAPLVLLLHGFAESFHTWRSQVEALAAAGYLAVAPSQRGYSQGARPDVGELANYHIDHLMNDAMAIVDACGKGEALYHSPFVKAGPEGPGARGGSDTLSCRPQRPARDCNERSLLRRFGAGVKVLTIVIVEKYTAYREEASASSAGGSLSLDGGVGGIAY